MNTSSLRSRLLSLAIHGQLVPQDPNDEPASALLARIQAEKANAEKGKKRSAKPSISVEDAPFVVPEGWCWCRLGNLFEAVSAKRVLKSDWQNEGIPFYRAREIVQLNKKGLAEDDLFITQDLYDEMKNKYGVPQKGDIMLSAVGSIGYTYIVKETDLFYYKDASVLCLKNVFNLDSEFFSMWMSTPFVQSQMYGKSKGTTVDTITLENLNSYMIPLPPLAEQRRIVSKIEEIFREMERIEGSL